MTNRLRTNPFWIRIFLWIGVDLFLLLVAASTLAPERALPAVGLFEPVGFIIRLYGTFQLSWAVLFFLLLKDVERNPGHHRWHSKKAAVLYTVMPLR